MTVQERLGRSRIGNNGDYEAFDLGVLGSDGEVHIRTDQEELDLMREPGGAVVVRMGETALGRLLLMESNGSGGASILKPGGNVISVGDVIGTVIETKGITEHGTVTSIDPDKIER